SDNDDINNDKAAGQTIDGVVPDQGEGGIGTLLIPGTVAVVHGCKHTDNAKKLIDFICEAKVEQELIAGRFLAYSVRDAGGVKGMDVNSVKVAHEMKTAVETALTILQERQQPSTR